MDDHLPQSVRVERREVSEQESRRANGPDWDRYADEYQATHGTFLGDAGFVWGPKATPRRSCRSSVTSRAPRARGGQRRRAVLALGARARRPGVGLDLSHRQLQHSLRLDEETGVAVPSVRGTATHLPFAPGSFDIVFCSFGALQFVSDIEDAVGEVARVLRPGGRFAFSVTHPTRWMFPDDPGEAGLTATQSYWDRTPYVEIDDATGVVSYVEHHRTLGDWVACSRHGFGSPPWWSRSGPTTTTASGVAGRAPAAG